MKSKITIEIDHDNQPIIVIEYLPSLDVRDTLVKRFLETFGGKSEYASFRFVYTPASFEGSKARVRPIAPREMEGAAQNIIEVMTGRQGSDGHMNGSNMDVRFDEQIQLIGDWINGNSKSNFDLHS